MTWSNSQYYANSTATTFIYPAITSGSSTSGVFSVPYVITPPPAPRKPTALEWLDAEVERTCAMARLAA